MTMTEDDEKRVPTLGGATVALEDIFSGRIVAERNVFAIGEHGLLVTLCVDHRRREVETVDFPTAVIVRLSKAVSVSILRLKRYSCCNRCRCSRQ